MPKVPGYKTLPTRRTRSQSKFVSQEAVWIPTPPNSSPTKITATEENLISIHTKIHKHMKGEKSLSKLEFRKLGLIVKRMLCRSSKEKEALKMAKDLLKRFYKENYRSTSAEDPVKTMAIGHPTTTSSSFGSFARCISTDSATNISDHDNNSNNNMDTFNVTLSQDFGQKMVITEEEKDNKQVFNSQATNVIKLKFHNDRNEEEPLSFPLELLTNTNFLEEGSINQSNQRFESSFPAGFTGSEPNTQNNDTLTITDNDMDMMTNSFVFQNLYKWDDSQKSSCGNLKISEAESEVKHISRTTNDVIKISKIVSNAENSMSISSISTCAQSPIVKIDRVSSNMEITSKNVPFCEHPKISNIQSSTLTQISDFPENFELSIQATPWDISNIDSLKSFPSQMSNFELPSCVTKPSVTLTEESPTQNCVLLRQETDPEQSSGETDYPTETAPTSASTETQVISTSQLPSEGSIWEKGNVTVSQATKYSFDETNVLPIISVDDDAITVVSVNNDDFEITEGDNEFLALAGNSSAETFSQPTQEINKASPKVNHHATESEPESFVFNLDDHSAGSSDSVVEVTPLNNPLQLIIHENKPIQLPTLQVKAKSVISETEDVIIDETQYTHSENVIFQNAASQKYGVSSPYKPPARSQSSSFLNYKSNAKHPGSSSLGRRNANRPVTNETTRLSTEAIETMQDQDPSEDIIVIDGDVPQKHDQMDTTASQPEKESFVEKQKKLEAKVMEKRKKYRETWRNMPITDKMSEKFIKRFHVRIFDDPVDSLGNIGYKPNFNCVYFPRPDLEDMTDQLESSCEAAKLMDDAVTKVVGELKDQNASGSVLNLPKNSASDSDSDSSDEEKSSNKRWLKEYLAKKKRNMKEVVADVYEERQQVERGLGYEHETDEQPDNEDRDEQLENIVRNMDDLDWLKE